MSSADLAHANGLGSLFHSMARAWHALKVPGGLPGKPADRRQADVLALGHGSAELWFVSC